MDLELSTAVWIERVSVDYLVNGGVIDLGIIKYRYLAFDAVISSFLRPRLLLD